MITHQFFFFFLLKLLVLNFLRVYKIHLARVGEQWEIDTNQILYQIAFSLKGELETIITKIAMVQWEKKTQREHCRNGRPLIIHVPKIGKLSRGFGSKMSKTPCRNMLGRSTTPWAKELERFGALGNVLPIGMPRLPKLQSVSWEVTKQKKLKTIFRCFTLAMSAPISTLN